jgi:8-oxo-dGTP pyrophosphatase MutT (NUDIX family)
VTRYVVGFLFNESRDVVAMIKKVKGPNSVIGRWNGIGGKVEATDFNTYEAMSREFREEAGVDIIEYEWKKFAVVEGYGWNLSCFCGFSDLVFNVTTKEEEVVEILKVKPLLTGAYNVVKNIPVLLTLALDQSGITTPVALYDQAS